MPDPFATALAVLHSAAGSVAADYMSAGGLSRQINVIWAQGSRDGGARSDRMVVDANMFDIRRVDVLQPARGDTLTVADPVTAALLTFEINGAAILDDEGMTWTCPTQPVDGA